MKALLLQRESMVLRRIARLWRSSGLTVTACEDPASALAQLDGVALVGSDEYDRDFVLEALEKQPDARGVIWTAEPIGRLVKILERQPRIASVLGRVNFESTPNDWELMMVARRLTFTPGDPVPLSAYLHWGGTGFEIRVQNSDELDAATRHVHSYVTGIGVASWIADTIGELVHELLMNAVYDAPVDGEGRARFAHDRKAKVTLDPREAALLKVGCDGVLLCVQVADPFGRLERRHVVQGLARGLNGGEMNQANGGAGLGIALCYNSTAAMVYDVLKGKRTEVTGIFELDVNRREFRTRARSLHFFERDLRAS
jgi:hypothetical protein